MKKNIVVIGGGTGSFTVLSGLKQFEGISITAIVTAFDSGGSSGVLRDQIGVLPAGDARRCLVALAEDEGSLRSLFMFRFGEEMENHSFGNLMIAALEKIYGDPFKAISEAGRILRIKGRVMPVSTDSAHLCAELGDGEIIKGECHIDKRKATSSSPIKRIYLEPQATIHPEVRKAILEADVVVLSPGDLFTSLVPNFLVQGMPETLRETTAKIVYVPNLMTKKGETDGFQLSDFIKTVLEYSRLEKVSLIICNKETISRDTLRRYTSEHAEPVVSDISNVEPLTDNIHVTNLVAEGDVVRHDPYTLARIIVSV